MDKRITQDAEYLICVLYDAYRLRRKNGELAEDAKMFGGSENIQEKYIPEWPTNDIDEAARELFRKELMGGLFADDSLHFGVLTDEGIVYMEHQFGDKLDRLAQRIAALRTAIFG